MCFSNAPTLQTPTPSDPNGEGFSNPITTPNIALFYCCRCDNGPYNPALYKACTSCGHVFCTQCPVEWARESDNLAANPSHNDNAPMSPRIELTDNPNKTFNAGSGKNDIMMQALPATPQQSSITYSSGSRILPALEASYGDDIEDGAQQALPADFFAARPVYGTRDETPEAVDGQYVWQCDACGNGPYIVEMYAACINCGHVRCQWCSCYEA